MDSILNTALEEICSHLQNGVVLSSLWSKLEPSLSSSNLDLSDNLKQFVWDTLRAVPTLKFYEKSGSLSHVDPSVLSFRDAEELNLKVVADEGLRNNFMGLYNVGAANANLSLPQRQTLERVVMGRENGMTQNQLAKELGIEGKNFHYAVKSLECQGLLVRQCALVRTKEAGDEGETKNIPSVTTNVLYSYRHAKHLGAQQKIVITKEEQTKESFGNVHESPATGDGVGGNVRVKDYQPAMKAVCDKLKEANGKVLVVSDIKKDLGYSGSSGHRAWRSICQRLKAANLVEFFDAKVDGKVEHCLRFVENSDPVNMEPRSLINVDEDFVEEQQVKFGKKCQITDQLVELPVEHQIYELIDAAGSEGLTRNEVMERLGIDNKKNYNRFVSMCSRFEMNLQSEMHKKAVAYRFRTSGKHNSESSNLFLKKTEDIKENKFTGLCIGLDAQRSDQNQTGSVSDCSSLKVNAAGPGNMQNKEINRGPSIGSPVHNECNHTPRDSQLLFLTPKDSMSDILLSTGMEMNGASPETPLVVSKALTKGSDPRYPCMSSTVDNARREKKILERLKVEKFILRAELYRWLVSLEKDKYTTTDRKTIDRILRKLEQGKHCKLLNITVPVVTHLGRTRTTLVVMHPSIQTPTPELVSEIHDSWRSFEINSRGKCSSWWREKNSEFVPVLEDVQRTPVNTEPRKGGSEAMRANGFILAKMVRAKLLHSFLWDYLHGSSDSVDALSSGKDVVEPTNLHITNKLFSLEGTMKGIPVELFLQVAGSTSNFDDMIEKCKRGLRLSDLSVEEYKSLMDTQATGRLSLVIDILRRLKLIRMVGNHYSENGLQVPLPMVSTYVLELNPYVEEPISKDAVSLSLGSLDLRPRIRHDFYLSSREAVEDYWQTLEYCYVAAEPRAAKRAFPGSSVYEVSLHRSWTKLGVMTAAQREELLKRVVKDYPSEKLPLKECGKIAKDLNLSLEQVLRAYYAKRRLQEKELQEKKSEKRRRPRKRKRYYKEFSEDDEVAEQLEEQAHPREFRSLEQSEEPEHLATSYEHDSHLQSLDNFPETGHETELNEDEEGCPSIINKCSFSKVKPVPPPRRNKPHSTRQRRFSWTEDADRQLVVQYVRHRAILGAKNHRMSWTLVPDDLPAPPTTCRKRMASLKCNRKFRSAVMRLCNMLSERYAKILEKTRCRSLNKDDLLLRDSTSKFPNNSDHNLGTGLQEEPWDNFDDSNIKKSLEEVLHYKRMAKFDTSKKTGSTWEDQSDHTSECDLQESEFVASTASYEDAQNHAGKQRSGYQHLNKKFSKILRGVDVSTEVYKSLAVSNAVELFKLVFLSASTSSEVPNLLAGILRRYSECDLFAAFNHLRDKKYMVGGHGSHKFSLSQQFLHSASASPFPTDSGKRATRFARWLLEKHRDLIEGAIDLSPDLQCGDVFHLFALVCSGELSISPCLPDEGIGEAEDLRSTKRKIDINDFYDDEKTKRLKSFVAAEGEIISRREKGFPGIMLSVSREEVSTSDSLMFKDDRPIGEKHCSGNHPLDCSPGCSSSLHSDYMKELVNSGSTVPGLEISCESPWKGMVRYAEHVSPLRTAEDQLSPIHPEIFRAVSIAIQKAGDQGLSIEEVSQITNIPGGKMTDLIIDVLQTFERVLKVNAYDSIRVVDSLYRSKYFLTAVCGSCQKLELPSWRKPVGGDDSHVALQSAKRDTFGAHSEREINTDVHKLTILHFPEEVDEPVYEKQNSSVHGGCVEGLIDESSKSSPGKLCVPIFPWINGDGTTNKIVFKGLRRRLLGIVMQNPAILEEEIIRRMDVLNPQSCRKLLELMILDNHLHVRKMLETTSNSPPPILGNLIGNSKVRPKMVCREHYFANPMSTALL